jgi:hypothetical protein
VIVIPEFECHLKIESKQNKTQISAAANIRGTCHWKQNRNLGIGFSLKVMSPVRLPPPSDIPLLASISPTFWRKAQMRWKSLFCAFQFQQQN